MFILKDKERNMKNFFTDGFYKFLLGFSVIILLSFGMLAYLGLNNPAPEGEQATPTTQLAQ